MVRVGPFMSSYLVWLDHLSTWIKYLVTDPCRVKHNFHFQTFSNVSAIIDHISSGRYWWTENDLSLWVSFKFLVHLCIPHAIGLQIAMIARSTLRAMAAETLQVLGLLVKTSTNYVMLISMLCCSTQTACGQFWFLYHSYLFNGM